MIAEKAEPISIDQSPNIKQPDGKTYFNSSIDNYNKLEDTPKKESRFNLAALYPNSINQLVNSPKSVELKPHLLIDLNQSLEHVVVNNDIVELDIQSIGTPSQPLNRTILEASNLDKLQSSSNSPMKTPAKQPTNDKAKMSSKPSKAPTLFSNKTNSQETGNKKMQVDNQDNLRQSIES